MDKDSIAQEPERANLRRCGTCLEPGSCPDCAEHLSAELGYSRAH